MWTGDQPTVRPPGQRVGIPMVRMSMDSLRVDVDEGASRDPVLSSVDLKSLHVRSSGLGDEGDRAVQTKGFELCQS